MFEVMCEVIFIVGIFNDFVGSNIYIGSVVVWFESFGGCGLGIEYDLLYFGFFFGYWVGGDIFLIWRIDEEVVVDVGGVVEIVSVDIDYYYGVIGEFCIICDEVIVRKSVVFFEQYNVEEEFEVNGEYSVVENFGDFVFGEVRNKIGVYGFYSLDGISVDGVDEFNFCMIF